MGRCVGGRLQRPLWADRRPRLAPSATAGRKQARLWNHINRNFALYQGPVARENTRTATQILRAGNFASSHRYASPVMGSGERRIWTRSVHPEPSPAAFW